jgi:hypothetical protein
VRRDTFGFRKVDRLVMLDCRKHRREGPRAIACLGHDGAACGGSHRGLDLRQLWADLVSAAQDRRGTERKGLPDHVMEVLLDDKQLFGNRVELAQTLLDLFHADHFTQIGSTMSTPPVPLAAPSPSNLGTT